MLKELNLQVLKDQGLLEKITPGIRKSAIHNLQGHLSSPSSQFQGLIQFVQLISSIMGTVAMTIQSYRSYALYTFVLEQIPLESKYLFPMICAINLKKAVKKNSTKPIDLSNF